MAAEFTATNGCSARRLARWMAAATSSLPVPDSPVMSTRVSPGATWATSSRIWRRAGEEPTISSRWPRAACRARLAARVRERSRAAWRVTRTDSGVSGFSRNWKAPSRAARTASASWALPLIMMTGADTPRSRSACRVARPSGPGGIIRSRKMASGSASSTVRMAALPLAASDTTCPSARSSAPSIRRMLASSSMRRMEGISKDRRGRGAAASPPRKRGSSARSSPPRKRGSSGALWIPACAGMTTALCASPPHLSPQSSFLRLHVPT